MPLYEIMCITTLQSTPQQLVNMMGRLANVIHKGKGVFRRVEHLGVRPLATRMKAHMKYNTMGRYVRLYIQASPVLCRDIETRLKVDDHVVRFLTIKHKQAAPVVVEKRVHNIKAVDTYATTGILTHSPLLEYHAAKALLALGYLTPAEILSLPRYKPDAWWEAKRTDALQRQAAAGSEEAAALLSIPIPSRAEDLERMAKQSEQEEAACDAYEEWRRSNNARKLADQDAYELSQDAAQAERVAWYERRRLRIKLRTLWRREHGRKPTAVEMAKLMEMGEMPMSPKQREIMQKRAQQRQEVWDRRAGYIIDGQQAAAARRDAAAAAVSAAASDSSSSSHVPTASEEADRASEEKYERILEQLLEEGAEARAALVPSIARHRSREDELAELEAGQVEAAERARLGEITYEKMQEAMRAARKKAKQDGIPIVGDPAAEADELGEEEDLDVDEMNMEFEEEAEADQDYDEAEEGYDGEGVDDGESEEGKQRGE